MFKHGTGNIVNPSGQDITLDVLNDKVFGFSDGTSLFVLDTSLATATGGGLAKALASILNGLGASLIGIEDAGNIIAAVTVEGALAEIMDELNNYRDQFVVATVTCADVVGGATDGTLNISLKQARDNATDPTTICQLMIRVHAAENTPMQALDNSTTFSAPTVGTIPASGTGWALVATNASGDFSCTITNSADETVWIWVTTAEGGFDVGKRCVVVACNPDNVTWSA